MITGGAIPTMSRNMPVANVIGGPDNADSPHTMSHTGMIAVRLNSLDIVVTLLSRGLRTTRNRGGRCRPHEPTRASLDLKGLGDSNLRPSARARGGVHRPRLCSALRGDLDLDLLGLGFLTQRQPDRQHAGLVLGADLASIDRRRQ